MFTENPGEQVSHAAQPCGVHPAGGPPAWTPGVVWAHRVRKVKGMQAAGGIAADLADGVVGAGVVVAGADEPAAVVVIDGYLV